jgi:hypothetical protein
VERREGGRVNAAEAAAVDAYVAAHFRVERDETSEDEPTSTSAGGRPVQPAAPDDDALVDEYMRRHFRPAA